MKTLKLKWLISVLLVSVLASCNFPLSSNNNSNSVDINTLVALQVAQTQLAQTITAGGQVQDTQLVSPTAQPLPQEPTSTPTITLTPMPTFTPTLEGVWLTVRENTNCRSGPGTNYDYVTLIKAGVRVQAIARNPDNSYFYVQNPNAGGFCWLWVAYSDLTGNINILPVYTPAPTPTETYTATPAGGLSVSFVGVTSCMGEYALRLKVKNTGSITWQSVKVVIKDTTAGMTFTHTLDQFRGYSGCSMDVSQEDLTPGEEGVISNVNPGQFGYDPTGHHLKVTVTVYSKDGQAGKSFSVSITVNA
jgi:hypothetical protein